MRVVIPERVIFTKAKHSNGATNAMEIASDLQSSNKKLFERHTPIKVNKIKEKRI